MGPFAFHRQFRQNLLPPYLLRRRRFVDIAAVPKKIGLIGLGLMGHPMGMNLLKAGFDLTVWNRTASKAADLVEAGAHLATSPAGVASSCDLLITIVSDPPALEEVLWGDREKNSGE